MLGIWRGGLGGYFDIALGLVTATVLLCNKPPRIAEA